MLKMSSIFFVLYSSMLLACFLISYLISKWGLNNGKLSFSIKSVDLLLTLLVIKSNTLLALFLALIQYFLGLRSWLIHYFFHRCLQHKKLLKSNHLILLPFLIIYLLLYYFLVIIFLLLYKSGVGFSLFATYVSRSFMHSSL